MLREHRQATSLYKFYILTLSFCRAAYKDIPYLYSPKPVWAMQMGIKNRAFCFIKIAPFGYIIISYWFIEGPLTRYSMLARNFFYNSIILCNICYKVSLII